MECTILASGSKGNCIYIGNDTDAVVIDAGIGYIYRILQEHHFDVSNIRGLLLTHEHSDHVRSAKAFLRASHVPVLGSGGTLFAAERAGYIPNSVHQCVLKEDISQNLGSLVIKSFRTYHDATEPTGFIIDDGETRMGVCLDNYCISEKIVSLLKSCDGVVIESNYSTHAMQTDEFEPCLECRKCGASCGGNGRVCYCYPRYLKDRIVESGHLSNELMAKTVSFLKDSVNSIALAHLSENYNRPNIARTVAEEALRESGTELYVSDQHSGYRENRLVRFSI